MKAAQSAHKYLGENHGMTQTMNESLNQASKKIAGVVQKVQSRKINKSGSKGVMSTENLETLIKD